MKIRNILYAALFMSSFICCGIDDDVTPSQKKEYDMTGFAKGADISWVTQMEKDGVKFYNAEGVETECFKLMREIGMNSIRLRVWVNPTDGWCNKEDMLVKAYRAHNLGMRIMVDFHYSDVWADPGSQTKPAAWAALTFDELKAAVSQHTTEVLTLLKNNGITPEWVQVGNETGNGMLWEEGRASDNMAQYAALSNAGYDAVKAVFPETKVIVHLHGGQDANLYEWLFDGLKSNGGRWDVIGMSLYPDADTWESTLSDCIANINAVVSRYGSEVMICETGMAASEAATAKLFLTSLMTQTKAITSCLGVFYWEPQSYSDWNGYKLGAFDQNGKPTIALDAFKD